MRGWTARLAASPLLASVLLAAVPGAARMPEKAPPGGLPEAVIYGMDDRMDIYELPPGDRRRELAKSVVALIPVARLEKARYGTKVAGGTYGERFRLKPGERFHGQPSAAACSGTLVGEDMVLTAGHCVESLDDCRKYVFAFDFMYDRKDKDLSVLPHDSVYWCVPCDKQKGEVIRRMEGRDDWALICLDRRPGRKPIPPALGAEIRPKAGVYTMGFPSGLPLKVAGGAQVRSASTAKGGLMYANLDTFGGNSGGPVFLEETHALVGILIAGKADFIPHPERDEQSVNRLPHDSDRRTEQIHPVQSEALKKALEDEGLGE